MFSLVQTVRYYQSRFIFLFAWRSFGVDFVSLILQHARHFLSLSREKCVRFCSREMMIWWEKKFEEERSKRETFATKSSSPKQRARLSLSSLSLELWNLSKRREREREIDARVVVRGEILIAQKGFKIAPERSASSRARTRCALFLSLSLHHLLHFTAFISSFASDSEGVCFRARFSRTIHSPYS